jgi:hypothetical protein
VAAGVAPGWSVDRRAVAVPVVAEAIWAIPHRLEPPYTHTIARLIRRALPGRSRMQILSDQLPAWLSVQLDAEINIDDWVWLLVRDAGDPVREPPAHPPDE